MNPSHPSEVGISDRALPLLDHLGPLSCAGRTRLPFPVRWLGWATLGVFLLLVLGLAFLPWQQFIRGAGRVIAHDPLDRSVTVESPLSGRVEKAYVAEGQMVRKGELMFQLADNDPQLSTNLEAQRTAAVARREAAEQRLRMLELQIGEQERTLPMALVAATNRLAVAQFACRTAELHYERIRALYQDERGLSSRRDFELATLERDRTRAEVLHAEALLDRTVPDLTGAINSIRAQREAARSDLAGAEQAITALTIQLNQVATQKILAPRDGIVLRVLATEGTFLRAGSPVCAIVPETENRMVELWINGNDMPLVRARVTGPGGETLQRGSPVRLQFEGWPAVQFVGWPSVALGTFGGEVVVIDATDDGKGRFRILVAPSPDEIPGPGGRFERRAWPGSRWLRQGVRANGWVLLERVPLWFEFWRQMNGFPPALDPKMAGVAEGK